jgi:hypothetical protein
VVKLLQFDILHNAGRNAKNLPYFIVLQSEQSIARDMVVVAPVYAARTFGQKIEKLHISCAFQGEELVLALEEMGAVAVRHLGPRAGNIGHLSYEIGMSLDFILKGI